MLAPDPVMVDVPPLQIAAGNADAVTIGIGFTVTITDPVEVHPEAEVPVTE